MTTVTASPDHTDTHTAADINIAAGLPLATGGVNARAEEVFLTGPGYTLTARQVLYCLAAHLARFGDTLAVDVVDPLCAIDAHMRFDGDLRGWTHGRTPNSAALLLARADQVARDYFGHHFPAVPW